MNLFDFSKIQDTAKLLKYRKVMLWIVRLCAFASVGMVSGIALGVTFGFNTIELIIVGISTAIAMITIIPSLFCFPCIDEIEKLLNQQLFEIDCPIEKRIQSWAVRMMFWSTLIILLPILISKLTS